MSGTNSGHSSKGSEWRRWDPHIHAPETLLNDQYKGDWETFFSRVEEANPAIQALGITDYFCILGYQAVKARKKDGELPDVGLIFPNVEMRLDVKTEKSKGINIHLLFSPHDQDHEAKIESLLAQLSFEFKDVTYPCTPTSLAQLGRAFQGKSLDENAAIRIGANQFKTCLSDLKELFKDPWAQKNCLVAVSGSGVDGTAGLQADDSFAATRQEIERFAHIIFSGNPKQRDFWLGKGVVDPASIEKTYGFLKPCLHGSDAHVGEKVGESAHNRYCWIKGDLTFETLRQAVIEPEERVCVSAEAPSTGMASFGIYALNPKGADWFQHDRLELNPGLVAVIGARGSGKTALVEIIAAATKSLGRDLADSSFLMRASTPKNYLEGASIEVEWGDGATSGDRLDGWSEDNNGDESEPEARYLSQQFVDRLCSSSGLAVELRREIERVVFEAISPADRMETDTFDELATRLLSPIRSRQEQLRGHIAHLSEQVAAEDISKRALPVLEQKYKSLAEQIAKLHKELAALLPKDKEAHAKQLELIGAVYRVAEEKLEALNLQQHKLSELAQHVIDLRDYTEPNRWAEMRDAFKEVNLLDSQWEAFRLVFAGDVDSTLEQIKTTVIKAIETAKTGDPENPVDLNLTPTSDWPLAELSQRLEAAKKNVGIDANLQKRYETLLRNIRSNETALKRLNTQIDAAKGADMRRGDLIAKRKSTYLDVFKSFLEEESVLKNLYASLAQELNGAKGALAKLVVVVYRRVDVGEWARRGEQFIDLRIAQKLRGKGALCKETERILLPAWAKGSPEEIAGAMETFRNEFQKDLMDSLPRSLSTDDRSIRIQEMAAWLYDTSHILVEYGIQFDGVAIEQLSPGTRGIVLLLLYLAIDKRDQRPLIVDQPEENLDPQSVYDELVPHFREARKRRQVILVTHNANLVVNTDADQVIVATAQRSSSEGLPSISYLCGSLENHEIRQAVCNILEGGKRAFLDRERRYRFRWDETINS